MASDRIFKIYSDGVRFFARQENAEVFSLILPNDETAQQLKKDAKSVSVSPQINESLTSAVAYIVRDEFLWQI